MWWKERLYAFLLRRCLGSILSPESYQQLHTLLLEVSILPHGTIVLQNVALNAEFITEKLKRQQQPVVGLVVVRSITIRKLRIHLEFQQQQQTNDAQTTFVSRAIDMASAYFQNNTSTTYENVDQKEDNELQNQSSNNQYQDYQFFLPQVAIVTTVELEGIQVEIEPWSQNHNDNSDATTTTLNTATNSNTSSRLSIILESALSALRLSVHISDFNVRIILPTTEQQQQVPKMHSFVECRLQSVGYHDNAPVRMTSSSSSLLDQKNDQVISLSKTLEWTQWTVLVGDIIDDDDEEEDDNQKQPETNYSSHYKTTNNTTTIALWEGTNRIHLRASTPDRHQFQQDIDVDIPKQIHVSLDQQSLQRVFSLLDAFRKRRQQQQQQQTSSITDSRADNLCPKNGQEKMHSNPSIATSSSSSLFAICDDTDAADLETIQKILQLYQSEVTTNVPSSETNEPLRGGILVPSVNEITHHVTFDTFFDANDHGFSQYYTSILLESKVHDGNHDNVGATDDWVHTNIRINIQQGGNIKFSFLDEKDGFGHCRARNRRKPCEYVLLSFRGVNWTSSMSSRSSDHSFSIDHLLLEDSLLAMDDPNSTDGSVMSRVDIGTLLQFQSSGEKGSTDDVEDATEGLVMEAPCILLRIKTIQSHGKKQEDHNIIMDIEMELEPLEITYRQITMSKLLSQIDLKSFENDVNACQSKSPLSQHSSGGQPTQMFPTLYCTCPSISIFAPVSREGDWRRLYTRCGYIVDTYAEVKSSSICLFLDRFSVEINKRDTFRGGDEHATSKDSNIQVVQMTCHHIMAYALSPLASPGLFDNRKCRRVDILALIGRTEVDPCVPVTIKITSSTCHSSSESKEQRPAMHDFPKVAPISSFKARQENDENDANQIDDDFASSSIKVDVTSTANELRSLDPQFIMLSDLEKCPVSATILVPEIISDLTVVELRDLTKIASAAFCLSMNKADDKQVSKIHEKSSSTSDFAITIACDTVSLAIHNSVDSWSYEDVFSFLLKMDGLKLHSLIERNAAKHARILAHEIDFYEVKNLSQQNKPETFPPTVDDQIVNLRLRQTRHDKSSAAVILHRSHLFPSISRANPCLLLDFLNVSAANLTTIIAQRNVYVTLYDLTFRYTRHSDWFQNLKNTFSDEENESSPVHVEEPNNEPQSLYRIFFAIADSNCDYSTLPRFNAKARAILRIGDFRISSNFMWPMKLAQALRISFGDLSLYLCSNQYPYNFENSCLLDAESVFQPDEISLDYLKSKKESEAADVLLDMNCRTVMTLDSMDGALAVSNESKRDQSDPVITASLSFGQVSLLACRDSFSLLMGVIGDVMTESMALNDEALEVLRTKSIISAEATISKQKQGVSEKAEEPETLGDVFTSMARESALVPIIEATSSYGTNDISEFLLDGYDWMTIESDTQDEWGIPTREEQTARWYPIGDVKLDNGDACKHCDQGKLNVSSIMDDSVVGTIEPINSTCNEPTAPRIISHHFPLHPVSDPIRDGDMGIAKYLGADVHSRVNARILVHDLSVNLRFFDGYDWPELLDVKHRKVKKDAAFVIPEFIPKDKHEVEDSLFDQVHNDPSSPVTTDTKSLLLGDLLSGGSSDQGSPFENMPLPEDRGRKLKEQAELRRLARRTNKFFQIGASGVSMRVDSLEESNEHRLLSCLNLKVNDFFVVETISTNRPIKMVGEWFNEQEHPRDSNDGLLMLKMVTWLPAARVTPENEIANNETEAGLKILPLRCLIDQRAVAFARAFFHAEPHESSTGCSLPPHLHPVPPSLFTMFRARPFKLKVDYTPQKLDTKALRDGAIVELINLSPLDSMVLTLRQVEITDAVGFGNVMSAFVSRLVQDIVQTQLRKFVTSSRPLEPITEVSGAAVDLLVLPWEAFRNGDSIQKALRSGVLRFSQTVLFEFCHWSSRAAEFVAGNASRATRVEHPSRPMTIPRGVLDAAPHAVESVSRGLQAANYKIVIVPYREYQRSGAKGAAKSVLKGIPVAIAAPAGGAAEALSFALLGVRNQVRPDIRKEEEVSLRGLQLD